MRYIFQLAFILVWLVSVAVAEDELMPPPLPDIDGLELDAVIPPADPVTSEAIDTPAPEDKAPPAVADKTDDAGETLPRILTDDEKDFMQQGYQMDAEPPALDGMPSLPAIEFSDMAAADAALHLDDEANTETEEKEEQEEEIENYVPPRPSLVRSFNYKNQHLPDAIYRKSYSSHNRHLPQAMYEADYDYATFAAAARNNVNGLRAMLRTGRPLHMQNAQGETLVDVAMRYRAYDSLRYLLAIGAPEGQAWQAASQNNDRYALAVLEAAAR